MRTKLALLYGLTLLLPTIVFAQRTFSTVTDSFVAVVRIFFPLIMVIAFLAFVWRTIRLIANADDDQTRAEAKVALFWSVIVLFLLVSLWGVIQLLVGIFFTG